MTYGTPDRQSAVAGVVVTVGLIALAAVLWAQSPSNSLRDPRVFPPSSAPFGKFYGEWGAEWWQWISLIPVAENPLLDATGEKCAVGQRGPGWFLAGVLSISGTAIRTCSVPEGTALFVPIANTFSAADPPPAPRFSVRELRDFTRSVIDGVTDVLVELDGIPIRNLDLFRFTSPVFVLTLPPDNIHQAPPGIYFPAVDEGFYVMLTPLSVGEHMLRIHEENPVFDLVLDVTYHLTVVPLPLP
jgi:hypothetical protein